MNIDIIVQWFEAVNLTSYMIQIMLNCNDIIGQDSENLLNITPNIACKVR